MVTTVTVRHDPIETWQHKALKELEKSLGQPIDLWAYQHEAGWIARDFDSERLARSASGCGEATIEDDLVDDDLRSMINSSADSGIAAVMEQVPGKYLLVIPLGKKLVATTSVNTESPGLLLGLAHMGSRCFHQHAEVEQLREENDFFLKQVSDDFEELTFLRSIAERLGLGDSAHSLEQLINASIRELGKSTHAEELYFVSNAADEQVVLASYRHEEIDGVGQEIESVMQILEAFRTAAERQPVIKNAFDQTAEGAAYPGVRDFVIVTVGNESTPLGWFVAINRLAEDSQNSGCVPEWRLNQHEFGTSEASLLSTAAAMISSHEKNLSLFNERETLLVNVVRTLVSAVEAKDQYTSGHSERVALYAKRLAEQVGYNEKACQLLYLTGLLHDVGKIAINDAILNKPDRLTDEEFAEIQKHPEEGWRILQGLSQLDYVLPGVLHHHERIDGKGYPDGLADGDIPLDGRILAVADAYDAMTSDRAYRTGMPHEKAISIIRDGAGTQWDAEAVAAFLDIENEITEIRESYRPREQPIREPNAARSLS